MPTSVEQASPWLLGLTFALWREEFDSNGYLIFERVLSQDRVAGIRAALALYLERDLTGRNDFEGLKTNRVYALLAKSPLFADLAIQPLALAFAEAELGQSCLLSALLAINLHPGETVLPWHFDDSGIRVPRPRPALGISAFWAIDDTTESNGSTEVIPGSHLWDGQIVEGAVKPADFTNKAASNGDRDFGNRPDAVKPVMPYARPRRSARIVEGGRAARRAAASPMIDDGIGFQLVPWQPVLDKRILQTYSVNLESIPI
jgi:hypothetical protein